jgi:hypothetical protein
VKREDVCFPVSRLLGCGNWETDRNLLIERELLFPGSSSQRHTPGKQDLVDRQPTPIGAECSIVNLGPVAAKRVYAQAATAIDALVEALYELLLEGAIGETGLRTRSADSPCISGQPE